MNKKIIIVLVVILVVGFGIEYFMPKNVAVAPVVNNTVSNVPVSNTEVVPVANTPVVPAVSAKEENINIKGFAFNPSTLTVKVGTKVTWTNEDSAPHTVTSDVGNLLNSPTLATGESFSFVFTSAGSIGYHCNIHKTMKGTIIVQ